MTFLQEEAGLVNLSARGGRIGQPFCRRRQDLSTLTQMKTRLVDPSAGGDRICQPSLMKTGLVDRSAGGDKIRRPFCKRRQDWSTLPQMKTRLVDPSAGEDRIGQTFHRRRQDWVTFPQEKTGLVGLST